MPAESRAVYLGGNPAFEIIPGEHNVRYQGMVRYPDRDVLESGWLIGEETLAKKAAMVAAQYGEGRVIRLGLQPTQRSLTRALRRAEARRGTLKEL